MIEESVWYINRVGTMIAIERGVENVVEIVLHGSDFVGTYANNMALRNFHFNERDDPAFLLEFQKHFPGAVRVGSLGDVPVWTYSGPQEDGGTAYAGRKVWLPNDPALDTFWHIAKALGQGVIAKGVPPKTHLMGRGAPRLFRRLYGGLSVEMGSDIFLGDWKRAVEFHARRIRSAMKISPRSNATQEIALGRYLIKHAALFTLLDRLRLAWVVLGVERVAVWVESDIAMKRLEYGARQQLVNSVGHTLATAGH